MKHLNHYETKVDWAKAERQDKEGVRTSQGRLLTEEEKAERNKALADFGRLEQAPWPTKDDSAKEFARKFRERIELIACMKKELA